MGKTILHYLYIPTFSHNSGIAHVMRAITCVRAGKKENKKIDIYISKTEIAQLSLLPHNVKDKIVQCMIHTFAKRYDAVFVDMRHVNYRQFNTFSKLGCCIGIDIGGQARKCFAYLIDTLPNLFSNRKNKGANISDPSLCVNTAITKRQKPIKDCKKILLYAINQNYAVYKPFFDMCTKLDITCNYVCSQDFKKTASEVYDNVHIHHIPYTDDIKNSIYTYDMVVTHYGLFAFEACKALVPVILVNPSVYHSVLSKKAGWKYHFKNYKQLASHIQKMHHNTRLFDVFLKENAAFYNLMYNNTHLQTTKYKSLYRILFDIADNYNEVYKNKFPFNPPVSLYVNKTKNPPKTIWRNKEKSIFFCTNTKSIYQIPFTKPIKYKTDYFFSEYKAQYGKTYLEDMPQITQKMQVRFDIISKLLPALHTAPNLIDIGCAYGAMVSVAKDNNCKVLGLDINKEVCSYVKKTLKIPTLNVNIFKDNFITTNAAQIKKIFNYKCADIITCFFVLEHAPYFEGVIKNILDLLVTGGILALSVPNGNGISMRQDKNYFFDQNPSDHFSIFSPSKLSKYLLKFGLKTRVLKITGHHPERFLSYGSNKTPNIQNNVSKTFYNRVSHLIKAGDTFELYLEKIDKT